MGHGAQVELCQVAGEPCVWCNGAVCHNNGTNRCEVYDVQVHGKGKVPGTDADAAFIPLERSHWRMIRSVNDISTMRWGVEADHRIMMNHGRF